jgi:hypothetical protein
VHDTKPSGALRAAGLRLAWPAKLDHVSPRWRPRRRGGAPNDPRQPERLRGTAVR